MQSFRTFFKEASGSAAATASIDVRKLADGATQNAASHAVNLTVVVRGI